MGLSGPIMFHRDFLAPSGSGLGFRGLSRNGAPNEVLLRMNVVETWFVAVWGLCWYNFVNKISNFCGTNIIIILVIRQ